MIDRRGFLAGIGAAAVGAITGALVVQPSYGPSPLRAAYAQWKIAQQMRAIDGHKSDIELAIERLQRDHVRSQLYGLAFSMDGSWSLASRGDVQSEALSLLMDLEGSK